MKNFSKYDYEFIVKRKLKESNDKSVYTAIMRRVISFTDSYKSVIVDESLVYNKDVIIIKIHRKKIKEINNMMTLSHKAIAKLLMFWQEGEYIIIIQEKILGLSIFNYIRKHKNLPSNKRIMMAYDLADVLSYLHRKNEGCLIHGDISPNNILISDNDELYLIDFGSSFAETIVKKEKKFYATEGYYSPKLIYDPMSVDKEIDIYSFAMILKLIEIDKISLEAYNLYRGCLGAYQARYLDSDLESYRDMESIKEELLKLIN